MMQFTVLTDGSETLINFVTSDMGHVYGIPSLTALSKEFRPGLPRLHTTKMMRLIQNKKDTAGNDLANICVSGLT